jgi:hypothetical protein
VEVVGDEFCNVASIVEVARSELCLVLAKRGVQQIAAFLLPYPF